MYHTTSKCQFVDVLFKRLLFVPSPLRGGATFLLRIQRTTVAQWIFIVAAPLRWCRQDTYSVRRFHPSLVMPCQDCSTCRGLKLPTLDATSSAAPCTSTNFTPAPTSFDRGAHCSGVPSNSFLHYCPVFLWAGVRCGKNSRVGWSLPR